MMSAQQLDRRGDDSAPGEERPYTDALSPRQIALLRRHWLGLAVFMGGPANVVMQMANYRVARGITESTVKSGSVYHHPFKRFRTTVGYLDIALFGDDRLRADYRNAINTSHRHIHSTAASPVRYNAFNRDLQLWVASCLYYGFRDIVGHLDGPPSRADQEELLQACARLATTLQVPAEMWHRNVAEFEAYWAEGMRDIHFDGATRAYATALVEVDFLSKRMRAAKLLLGRPTRFFNIGFLTPELRAELGFEGSDRDEKLFNSALRTVGIASRPFPFAIRRVPTNWMSTNLRVRRALGKPMV